MKRSKYIDNNLNCKYIESCILGLIFRGKYDFSMPLQNAYCKQFLKGVIF